MEADEISYIIGAYLVSMIVGALLFPRRVEVDEPARRAHRRDVLRRDRVPAVPA